MCWNVGLPRFQLCWTIYRPPNIWCRTIFVALRSFYATALMMEWHNDARTFFQWVVNCQKNCQTQFGTEVIDSLTVHFLLKGARFSSLAVATNATSGSNSTRLRCQVTNINKHGCKRWHIEVREATTDLRDTSDSFPTQWTCCVLFPAPGLTAWNLLVETLTRSLHALIDCSSSKKKKKKKESDPGVDWRAAATAGHH